ncbi:hypothetical protein PMAYCL1PPCAC_26593, partial [Pristionchus mayeri]
FPVMSTEFVIRWEVDEVSKLTDKARTSPIHHHSGLPWRLLTCTENSVRTKNINQFSLYLCCNEDNDSLEWSCDCSYALYIIHRSDPEKNHKTQEVSIGVKYSSSRGEPSFYKFSEVLKRKEGFVKDDKTIVEVHGKMISSHCIREKMYLDFFQPLPLGDNVAVKLEDGELHVCRRYLMWHSPYFASLFFGD